MTVLLFLMGISFLVFAFGIYQLVKGLVLGQSGRTTREAAFRFTACMFIAAFLYHVGREGAVAFFHAIQMAGANMEYEPFAIGGIQDALLSAYGLSLYICAPASTIILIATYLSELVSPILVRWWSPRRDTFVISRLDERSLHLASSIRDYYYALRKGGAKAQHVDETRKNRSNYPCIVFASVDSSLEDELSSTARGMGAICTAASTEEVLHWCSDKTLRTALLTSSDEVENISLTQRIKKYATSQKGRFEVFAMTSLRNSETLLFPEVLTGDPAFRNRVVILGVDITRELVSSVIEQYPLFLVSNPKSAWQGLSADITSETTAGSRGDEAQIKDFYTRGSRHIVVVGAGQFGLEFASSAVWASRIDGIHTRIDVIDHEAVPGDASRSMAEARFNAIAPEIASNVCERGHTGADNQDTTYNLHFSCIDAESDRYASFIEEHAETITYVIVALGDDMLDAKVAMRTRQILERELIRRCAKEDGLGKEGYLTANRPLVIAVIEDNELASIVGSATNEGQPYDIVCVGKTEASPTYQDLLKLDAKKSEYNRRSSRAARAHVKYCFFAWLRNAYLGRRGMVRLDEVVFLRMAREIDWTKHPQATWEAVGEYERYRLTDDEIGRIIQGCKKEGHADEPRLSKLKTRTHPFKEDADGEKDEPDCRQWLLEMEHSRWNAYVRVEGFRVANEAEVAALFDTGQVTDKDRLHRSNLSGMHPYLVSYGELAQVTKWIRDLYEKKYSKQEVDDIIKDMRLSDDKYTSFFCVDSAETAKEYLDVLLPPDPGAGN